MSDRSQDPITNTFPIFEIPETAELVIIARRFLGISEANADLHLVITSLPNFRHPWMKRTPPLRLVRPDLAAKPPIPREPNLIPGEPVCQYLFFGDARLMDRFTPLTVEATALLRSLMPWLETIIRAAGPDEPSWRANLWPWLLPEIFENADPQKLLHEFERFERPEFEGASFLAFNHDVFRVSCHALMTLVGMYGAKEIVDPTPIPPPRQDRDDRSPTRSPGALAIAAAYELSKAGRPVSLKAACEKAGVDRKNVERRYPEAVSTIKALSVPDRPPRRGRVDRRTGVLDGVDERDD